MRISRTILTLTVLIDLLCFRAGLLPAGQDGGDTLAFDVTSVRPTLEGGPRGSIGFQPGGRFIARNMPVLTLVSLAFITSEGIPLQPNQLIGVPQWSTSSRFDVEAQVRPPRPAGIIPMNPTGARLIRTLLEDRFRLRAHFETRDAAVYVLSLATDDNSLGPQLHRSTTQCTTSAIPRQIAPNNSSPGIDSVPACSMRVARGKAVGSGVTMASISQLLMGAVGGTPVVDRTGLQGTFDIDLHWSPASPVVADATTAPPLADGPSIFTAVQEQLGLKLQEAKAPRPVLVIDNMEIPNPD
jgi:uncharacterized protein (TIGR03435 family)